MRSCEVCYIKKKIQRQPCGCKKVCNHCLRKYYDYAVKNGQIEIKCVTCRVVIKILRHVVKPVIKACPGCKVLTERVGGCEHMRCPLCLQHWCWNCCTKMYYIQGVQLCYICSRYMPFITLPWFILSTLITIPLAVCQVDNVILYYTLINVLVYFVPWILLETIITMQALFEIGVL